MARTAIKKATELRSWDDVNEALRQIAELKANVTAKTAAYNEEEAKRRKQVDDYCNPLREKLEQLEIGMQNFCVANRSDFGNKKSRELPNGRVDFRLGLPKVEKQKGFTWAGIFEIVKQSRFAKQFIRVKEELNKDAILAYYSGTENAAGHLAEVYLSVVQEETFGYDVNMVMTQ